MIIGVLYMLLAVAAYILTGKLSNLYVDLNIMLPNMVMLLIKGREVISVCLTALGLYCVFDKRATDGVVILHIGLIVAGIIGYIVVMGMPLITVIETLNSQ